MAKSSKTTRKTNRKKSYSRKIRGGMDNNNINNIDEIDLDIDDIDDINDIDLDIDEFSDSEDEFDDPMMVYSQKPFFYDKFTKTYAALGHLNKFPDNIPKETKVLLLQDKKITEIPDSIGELTNLETFMIGNNKINKISPKIGKLTKLRGLDLGINNLTSIPPEIGKLTNLVELSLDNNQLTSIPSKIGKLSKLETLNLGDNKLTELPPEITNLRKLENLLLDRNNLKILPNGMDRLVELSSLDVNENPDLETLPVELTKLPKLKMIGSCGNNYEWLDDVIINKFRGKLGNYYGPIPNQECNTNRNIREFHNQNDDETPFISGKLNKDVASKIFSFLPSVQQKELIKSRNINKGGRKTRRKSSRKSKRRHR